ncbi:hypothetical protein AWV80_31480 [Cupriavidus sp. UYMU48A]|nr:hypothetical protein AWV80_31480 [Cupriavidus sp. UYMU48A]
MRPLGGILISNYADRAGRRAALTLTILLMMAGTALIAYRRAISACRRPILNSADTHPAATDGGTGASARGAGDECLHGRQTRTCHEQSPLCRHDRQPRDVSDEQMAEYIKLAIANWARECHRRHRTAPSSTWMYCR